MDRVKIGLIGCGNISDIYLTNLTTRFNNIVDLVAVADLIPERAAEKAEKYGVRVACSVEEMLANPEIELVVNLTIPIAHASVNLRALEAGKSVYVEKPLAISREDGKKTVDLAKKNGLLVGGAPDTFMGAGLQGCRKLIDEGWIGRPVAAIACMACHGHESWHPAPAFYYQLGGGPLFDMGPYYLTALVHLLGPIANVAGSAKRSFDTRTITSKPMYGTVVDVEVPTHVAGVLNFESGAVGTLLMSFDIWGTQMPCIEIHGSHGSLQVPDPNTFGGVIRLKRPGSPEWETVPSPFAYAENSRGMGVADMALALRGKRAPRASGDLTYHVLDVMHAIHEASDEQRNQQLGSACARPEPLPLGLRDGQLEI